MCTGLHVKYRLFLSDFNENGGCVQIFEKYSNIKFRENPSNGNQVVPCGWMEAQTDRHTNITELIVAFYNVANAPKIGYLNMCISRFTIDCTFVIC
jgi:hypothetical protein